MGAPSAGMDRAGAGGNHMSNEIHDPATVHDRIRELNDAFRRAGPSGTDWVLTRGVHALGLGSALRACRDVQVHTVFSEGDDPYGEHDFGAVEYEGRKLFWKIDYYDLGLAAGSPDPADPRVTRRVLTIMLEG